MGIRETAIALRESLLEEVGDELLAVGWYSEEQESRTESVYISEEFSEHEGKGRGVLETSMLESLGHAAHEAAHGEDLLTTIRHYETVIDIDVHFDEFEGIVIALSPSEDYQLDNILEIAEEEVPETIGLSAER